MYCSERNLKFLLYEVLNIDSVTKYEYFKESKNKRVVDMTIKAAFELADRLFRPIYEEMDKKPPYLKNGELVVHEKVKEIMKECGDGGWIGAAFPIEYDGFQMPAMLHLACRFILSAANYSAGVFPNLTSGAARLILNFGTALQKKLYLPKMINGQWQGTMALTEPDAGSFLGDIKTLAEHVDSEDYYRISGQKIFISAGDHNNTENVVHLLLARIKGAPSGVKGISLFVVPKLRVEEDNKLLPNDVVLAEVFHKLGYKGCPITKLNFGDNNDCRGYLVGEENKGLTQMFQMMNEARISVGIGATAIASAAYYSALYYTKERRQGRSLDDKDQEAPVIPIIEHPDVKRMLLYQKSVIEGALCLLLQGAKYSDLEIVSDDDEKKRFKLLLDLLTPIFKGYPTEKGVIATSNALQCFGGYGYCDDFPVEQMYRDIRIHPLHEGTTGIQAIDLLNRKIRYKNGKAYEILCEEIFKTINQTDLIEELKYYSKKMEEAIRKLTTVTEYMVHQSKTKKKSVWLSDATLYLDMFGTVVVAWQWLVQGKAIVDGLKRNENIKEKKFYKGKLNALRFFFDYELNTIYGLSIRLLNNDELLVEMQEDEF
ncbi:acyl-CoA dehydrogenase [uncultured Desulfosarcina sp.]|uniref:acyl-CoA dehydrogenase n=1 Tax=uncultured Desulfosarcina sp. TaxID=218289 RepID=UPI0029C6828E|nr:acyl-CoA dehydrogenase [uncultured Desulfosarcina sp.]